MPISLKDLTKLKKKRVTHKFRAVQCEGDGIKFPSKLEKNYYYYLKRLQREGVVLFFLRQVSFDLPGKVRYVCDFQVFYTDGNVSFIDTKGKDTQMSINKRKQVEELYPVQIEIVSRVP